MSYINNVGYIHFRNGALVLITEAESVFESMVSLAESSSGLDIDVTEEMDALNAEHEALSRRHEWLTKAFSYVH